MSIEELDDETAVIDEPEIIDEPDESQVDIHIGDEQPKTEEEIEEENLKGNAAWVKMRQREKEARDRAKELEAQLAELTKPPEAPTTLVKPTLSECDWDDEVYEAALLQWHVLKQQDDDKKAAKQIELDKGKQHWETKLTNYETAKKALKVENYDESEDAVVAALSSSQQALIVKYAKEPEKVVYALGKTSAKLAELKTITDPIEFALAMRDIESQMKTVRRSVPPPETRIVGGAAPIQKTDATYEKLMAAAEKSGNFTEAARYKKANKL